MHLLQLTPIALANLTAVGMQSIEAAPEAIQIIDSTGSEAYSWRQNRQKRNKNNQEKSFYHAMLT
jgi:hypothetical protein